MVDKSYTNDQTPVMQSVTGKQLPNNIDAEQSVLAACILNPEAIEEVATKLVPDNFYRPAHQRIFEAMLDLNLRHVPIDQISLAERLNAMPMTRSLAFANGIHSHCSNSSLVLLVQAVSQ